MKLSAMKVFIGLACLAFASAASAQQKGFFVYPGSGGGGAAGYSNSVGTSAIECSKFDANAKKEQTVQCKIGPVSPSKAEYPNRPPYVLLFNTIDPKTFCYWDPVRQVWVCH